MRAGWRGWGEQLHRFADDFTGIEPMPDTLTEGRGGLRDSSDLGRPEPGAQALH